MRLVLIVTALIVLAAPCFAQEAAPGGPFTDVEVAVCAAIEERQPVGTAESFGVDIGQVFFWTKCVGATDTTAIQHVWVREGETMATVDLPVKSPEWRTWSSKKFLPSWTGNWEVRVLDSDGNIIKAVAFTVTPGMPAPEAPEDVTKEVEPEPEPEPETADTAEVETDADSP